MRRIFKFSVALQFVFSLSKWFCKQSAQGWNEDRDQVHQKVSCRVTCLQKCVFVGFVNQIVDLIK